MKSFSLCAFLAVIHAVYSTENVTITTSKGTIIGMRIDPNTATNVSYDAFLGIQYGNVTARFQLAQAVDSWTTPKVTQSDGPDCPQSISTYSEQCLYLNIYTPVNASASPGTLPVMAFIHGGGFIVGGISTYGPDFLIPEDVILVAFNYRLGATGFLTMGSKIAPGNQGLFDTVLALQWVQDEISVFGGDPTRVTLFGQSAGAFIIQWYNLSPYFTGLFTRSITESGGAFRDYATYTPTEGARRAKLLASALNCSTTASDSEILACLQAANITDLVDNQDIDLDSELLTVFNTYTPWMPVMDTSLTAEYPFFGDSLENLMPEALARGKEMIIGFNSDEGISKFGSDESWMLAEANLDYFIPEEALAKGLSDDQKSTMASEIKSFYFPGTVDDDKVEDLVQLYTAAMFGYASVKMARYFSNFTYGYIFSYVGSWNQESAIAKYKLKGVSHGDELNYIFYTANSDQYLDTCPTNQPNLDIKNQMVSWWTSFAKNGTPGSWEKISDAGYMIIDSTLSYYNASYADSLYYDLWAGLAAVNASSSNSTSNSTSDSTSAASTHISSSCIILTLLGFTCFSL